MHLIEQNHIILARMLCLMKDGWYTSGCYLTLLECSVLHMKIKIVGFGNGVVVFSSTSLVETQRKKKY